MKILVLGGTAFLGKEIVKQLHAAGHSLTLFTRGQARPKDLPAVHYLVGDRTKEEDLKQAAARGPWDLLIDNLAFRGSDMEVLFRAFPKMPRYILTSTISVYRYAKPHTPQPLVEGAVSFDSIPKEQDLADVHWSYAHGKWDAERVLRNTPQVSWTIFRPTMIYGPQDNRERGFWYLCRLLDGSPLLLSDGGQGTFRLAFVDEVASAYRWAVDDLTSVGKTYNLANPDIFTLKEFLTESAEALKVRLQTVSVPHEYLGEMGGPLAMNRSWISDTSAFENDSGLSYVSGKSTVQSIALWFKENWKGDLRKLKATRDEELRLIEKWKQATKLLKA